MQNYSNLIGFYWQFINIFLAVAEEKIDYERTCIGHINS